MAKVLSQFLGFKQAHRRRSRRSAWRVRTLAVTLAAALCLLGAVGVAPVNAAPSPQATIAFSARNLDETHATAASAEPCFKAAFPDCSSSDPAVSWESVSEGDTSSCTWKSVVDWGNGTSSTYTISGGADGAVLFTYEHTYSASGTYTITQTGTTIQGSCPSSPYTLEFTLTGAVTQKIHMAALGDSYSAGEGTGIYYTDSGSCHRSPDAWPKLYSVTSSIVTMPHANFLACSGADSADLIDTPFKGQQPQLDVLSDIQPAPKLITLTIGGNDPDVGFSNLLADCYHKNCIRNGVIAHAAATIQDEKFVLENDYDQVKTADPAAKILVVGYPRIFESDDFCGIRWLGLGFKPAELAALNNLAAEFNNVIAAAAADDGVTYIDVTNALHGHEMCSSHPWVVQVDVGGLWDQEEGHPTIPGQEAIAAIVRTYINSHF
jgi:GDSL-like Lipase/Acylhydrolase family